VRTNKREENFIPKERGSLPRVLLLDFASDVIENLKESKFQVFEGKSGFVDGIQNFPIDSSEIEIIFWDISNCQFNKFIESQGMEPEDRLSIPPEDYMSNSETDVIHISKKSLYDYFKQVRTKEGFIGIFFGEYEIYDTKKLSGILGLEDFSVYNGGFATFGFDLEERYCQRIELQRMKDDFFYNFFNRFFQNDKDLKFAIKWKSETIVNRSVATNKYITILSQGQSKLYKKDVEQKIVKFYFNDEDNNHYAVFAYDQILISPKIKKFADAILCLLQDILPNICNADIYPDLQTFKWLQDDFFKPREVKKGEIELSLFKKDYEKNLLAREVKIKNIENQYTYLHRMLYSDDSDIFKKGEKLKDIVKQILEKDLSFKNVFDMDEERQNQSLALKEDLKIGDDILIEVKGTERGAKASWVDEFRARAFQYCSASNIRNKNLKLILVFNHERRKDPRERHKPFENDPELLKSSENGNISLMPIFELYKMIMDIKEGYITEDAGREIILQSKGMFEYTRKHKNE